MVDINTLLKLTQERKASDLHITVGNSPILRINGDLFATDYPVFSRENAKSLIYSMLDDDKKTIFEKNKELDFSFALPAMDRFRINIHIQKGNVEAALRRVPNIIPTFEELGLPEVAYDFIKRPSGLVLITGPTGTGKSTTLASMIEVINNTRSNLILTVEDPIEFVFTSKKCILKQREVYSDTHSFPEALKRVLRQDPDVIVVGEMRDLDTISTTLTAAETGHLVLATLHTPDAPQTIQRIIDVFPPHQQEQIRTQLSLTLQAIVAQQLIPRKDGKGLILAVEIMVVNSAIRNIIRKGTTQDIYSMIELGTQQGMISLDSSLRDLYKKGLITKEDTLMHAINHERMEKLLGAA